MRFIVLPHCACAPCVRTDGQAELLASERSERDTLRSVQLRIADIYIIGERAKRARHSQVCSIENRGYIYKYYVIVIPWLPELFVYEQR